VFLKQPCLFFQRQPLPADAAVANQRTIMGKYFLGWILGVPVFVLAIIYFIFN
jgi:hypothetical protein